MSMEYQDSKYFNKKFSILSNAKNYISNKVSQFNNKRQAEKVMTEITKISSKYKLKPEDLLLATQGKGPIYRIAKRNRYIKEVVADTRRMMNSVPPEVADRVLDENSDLLKGLTINKVQNAALLTLVLGISALSLRYYMNLKKVTKAVESGGKIPGLITEPSIDPASPLSWLVDIHDNTVQLNDKWMNLTKNDEEEEMSRNLDALLKKYEKKHSDSDSDYFNKNFSYNNYMNNKDIYRNYLKKELAKNQVEAAIENAKARKMLRDLPGFFTDPNRRPVFDKPIKIDFSKSDKIISDYYKTKRELDHSRRISDAIHLGTAAAGLAGLAYMGYKHYKKNKKSSRRKTKEQSFENSNYFEPRQYSIGTTLLKAGERVKNGYNKMGILGSLGTMAGYMYVNNKTQKKKQQLQDRLSKAGIDSSLGSNSINNNNTK